MTDKKTESGTETPTKSTKKTGQKSTSRKNASTKTAQKASRPKAAPAETVANVASEVEPITPVAAAVGSAPMQSISSAQPEKSNNGIGWLALACSLVALGASGYAWYQTAVNARIAGGEQGQRLGAIEQKFGDFNAAQSGVTEQIKSVQSGVTEQIDQIKQRVATSETSVADQVSQVKQLVSSTESGLGAQISALKQLVAKSETTVGEQLRGFQTGLSQQQNEMLAKLDASDQGFSNQAQAFRGEFDTLAGSIVDLKSELGTSVDGWSLREIEHLLVLANQRVQLGQDVEAASSALKIADSRLQELDNPQLLDTRKAISGEIAALDAIAPVDFGGVTSTLSLLSSTLDDLPLLGLGEAKGPVKPAGQTDPDTAAGSQSASDKIADVGRSFLADLSSLVQVEKGGKPVAPSISPEIEQMILAKGRLMLEGAQIALLRQQPEIYLDRVNATESWVTEKFDTGNAQTTQWLEQLASLKGITPRVEYPDISGSLSALRSVIGSEG